MQFCDFFSSRIIIHFFQLYIQVCLFFLKFFSHLDCYIIYTLLYLMWITVKDQLQHRKLCSILCNKLMVTGGRMGEGIVRESGMDMDTLLCLTWRTSKDLPYKTGNSAHYFLTF